MEKSMSEDQKPAVELPTQIKPTEIAIPEKAQGEIVRLHADLVAKAKDFEAARMAFGEFVRIAKHSLRVPANERWEIKEDASAFIQLSDDGSPA
jgi:hypothetical protein